jgi:hypothetical protein
MMPIAMAVVREADFPVEHVQAIVQSFRETFPSEPRCSSATFQRIKTTSSYIYGKV